MQALVILRLHDAMPGLSRVPNDILFLCSNLLNIVKVLSCQDFTARLDYCKYVVYPTFDLEAFILILLIHGFAVSHSELLSDWIH